MPPDAAIVLPPGAKAYRKPTCERVRWPPGPWHDEPDVLEWAVGEIACLINRNEHFGTLNGYVGVPKACAWYGLDLHELDDVRCHGGVSFAEPAPDGRWWVGFDCGRARDITPLFYPRFAMPGARYRDVSYVVGQVEELARQAIEACTGAPVD